jgi:hypothetical protein
MGEYGTDKNCQIFSRSGFVHGAVPGQERAEGSGRKAPSICRDLVQREINTMDNLQGCGVGELYRNALARAGKSKAATGWLPNGSARDQSSRQLRHILIEF